MNIPENSINALSAKLSSVKSSQTYLENLQLAIMPAENLEM